MLHIQYRDIFLNMDYGTFIVYNILAGHYRPVSETPFQWRFAGGPIVARFMLLKVNYIQHSLHLFIFFINIKKAADISM